MTFSSGYLLPIALCFLKNVFSQKEPSRVGVVGSMPADQSGHTVMIGFDRAACVPLPRFAGARSLVFDGATKCGMGEF